jgi:hypothetical protein
LTVHVQDQQRGQDVALRFGLLRVCASLGDSSWLDGARVLVVADVLRRVVEDVHGGQALLGVLAGSSTPPMAEPLSVRAPSVVAASMEEITARLGGPVDLVVGQQDSSPNLLVGPVPAVEALDDDDPLAVRLVLLGARYAEPVSVTASTLGQAAETLRARRARVREWAEHPSAPMPAKPIEHARAALDDDLNVPAVLDVLDAVAHDDAVAPGAKFEAFVFLDRVLALDLARDVGR